MIFTKLFLQIGISVYIIIEFFAFFFMLIGTCLPQFTYKLMGTSGRPCFTLFVSDANCMHSPHLSLSTVFSKSCKSRINYFRAGQAFAIISIFLYFAAFVIGTLQFLRKVALTYVITAINVVGIVTGIIAWLVMIHVYNSDDIKGSSVTRSECRAFKTNYNLSAGFALIILGWVLNLIAIGFLYIPL